MKLNLGSKRVDIPCPHCGHKVAESLGRLQRDPHLTCSNCGKGFDVDASGLRKGIKSVEDSLAKLKRDIGKAFK